MNSTCGIDGNPSCHGISPHDPDAGSHIVSPDVAMTGVGRYKENFASQVQRTRPSNDPPPLVGCPALPRLVHTSAAANGTMLRPAVSSSERI